MALRVGIVAGEASGDQLGAGLIRAVKRRVPDAVFEGIAGPRMVEAGCRAWYPAERLAVMGLVEVLAHLPGLLGVRRDLVRRFSAQPPHVFIGIDAPDFNLGLERKLKARGIPTVHYVSPSVWAWRQQRVRKIARAVDLMLTLFPFEADFYRRHGVVVEFVGHPLADALAPVADRGPPRARLGLPAAGEVVALLPGSRVGELRRLAATFVQTAAWLHERRPALRFIAPLATPATRALFEHALREHGPQLLVTVGEGLAHEAISAADVVLAASGTVCLEALLLDRPMVVAYRLARPTYWIARRLVKVPRYSLPNLLVGRELVHEFTQDAATPENLGGALLELLQRPEARAAQQRPFGDIRAALRRDADRRAADAVLALLEKDR